MKKFLFPLLAMLAVPAFGADIDIGDITSKKQIEQVSNEFAVNFSHTAVAAPETDGLWGIEVGVVGGSTGTPKLKDLVNEAGGDGSDFKSTYHAAMMARAHFPLGFFVEVTALPQRKISDVDVASRSLGLGWNLGEFTKLPFDLAVGANFSSDEVSFKQDISNSTGSGAAKISVDSKTRVLWTGVSKTFMFFTPYAKIGVAHTESKADVDANGTVTVFTYSGKQSEKVSTDGGYLALGANLQFAFLKLGFEFSQTNTVKRASGKISLDF
ncbi:MAG: DUF6588 family protein [Bacteriovoracaceae bacterium]